MKKLRVGFIGCGEIVRVKHIPALRKLPAVEFSGFFDLNQANAMLCKEYAGNSSARIYEKLEDLFNDSSIDVVYICTPNKFHAPYALNALECGKHVMCEKPMAISSAEGESMISAAKKSGKKLSISFQNRFRPDSLLLHEYCKNGELGEIYFAKAHALRRRAIPAHGMFFNKEMQGGGALIDIGCHSIDLVLWMMNNYEVSSVLGKTFNKIGHLGEAANAWGVWDKEKIQNVEDTAVATINMKNGAVITLECSWCLNTLHEHEARCSLYGTKAGAEMSDKLVINGEKFGNLYTTYPNIEKNSYKYYLGAKETHQEMDARLFIEAVINDTEPAIRPEETLVVTKIIEGIYESNKTGELIRF